MATTMGSRRGNPLQDSIYLIGIDDEGETTLLQPVTTLNRVLPYVTTKKSYLYSKMRDHSVFNNDTVVTFPAAGIYAGQYEYIGVLKLRSKGAITESVAHQQYYEILRQGGPMIHINESLVRGVEEDIPIEYRLSKEDGVKTTTNHFRKTMTKTVDYMNVDDPRVIVPTFLQPEMGRESIIYTPNEMIARIYRFYTANRAVIDNSLYFYITLRIDMPGVDGDYDVVYRTVHLKNRTIEINNVDHERGLRMDSFEAFEADFMEYFKSAGEASADLISGSDNWHMINGGQINTGEFRLVICSKDMRLENLMIGYTAVDFRTQLEELIEYAGEDFTEYCGFEYYWSDPHSLIGGGPDVTLPEEMGGKFNRAKDCILSCIANATLMSKGTIARKLKLSIGAARKSGIDTGFLFWEGVEQFFNLDLAVYELTLDENSEPRFSTVFTASMTVEQLERQESARPRTVFMIYKGHCYVGTHAETSERLREISKATASTQNLYVAFDIETVSNFSEFTVDPVMISSYETEKYWVQETPNASGFAKGEPLAVQPLCIPGGEEMKVTTYSGKMCIRQWFADLKAKVDKYCKVYAYAYNGAKFDNWVVLKEITNDYDSLTSMLYYDNALFFSVGGLIFRDIFKYGSPGPLAFKTAANKHYKKIDVGGISFNRQNRVYNEMGCNMEAFIGWMKNEGYWSDYVRYCEYDVLSMAEYAFRVRGGFLRMFDVDMFEFYTLGAMSLNIFKGKTGIEPERYSPEMYKRFLAAQYAGISYSRPYDKVFTSSGTEKGRSSFRGVIDLVSQYPAALLNFLFPTGELKELDDAQRELYEQDLRTNNTCRLGLMEVSDVDQSALGSICIIPHRTGAGYDYQNTDKIIKSATITSADFVTLVQNGGNCTVDKVWAWDGNMRGHKLFGKYIIPPAQDKTKQDIVKAARGDDEAGMIARALVAKYGLEDVEYDGQVRETSKLVLNIITGKMSQKFRTTNYVTATSKFAFDKAIESDKMSFVTNISPKVQVFKETKKLADQESIPSYMPFALFIYSYARRMLHDVLQPYSMEPLLMETDSLTITTDEIAHLDGLETRLFNVMTEEFEVVPLMFQSGAKLFGQYELEEGRIYTRGVSIAKKSYFLEDERTGETKYKFKGISKRSVLVEDEGLLKLYRNWQECKHTEKRVELNTELYGRINDYLDQDDLPNPFNFDCYRRILAQHEYAKEVDREIAVCREPDRIRELKKAKRLSFILIAYSSFHKVTKGDKFMIEPSIGLKKL